MRVPLHGLFATALLALTTGCSPADAPSATTSTATTSAPDAGPCAEPGQVFGLDTSDKAVPLEKGTILPITQGFQGFIFVSVGLRAPSLPPVIELYVHVDVAEKVHRTTAFAAIGTHATDGGGMESTDVRYMFNDVSLADIVGQRATIKVWTTSPGCVLEAVADVRLTTGNFMGPDGGWDRP